MEDSILRGRDIVSGLRASDNDKSAKNLDKLI
jgi:hypothetical protein